MNNLNTQDIILNAPVGIYRCNLEGKLLEVNKYVASMFGYKSTESMLQEVNETSVASLYKQPSDRQMLLDKVIQANGGWASFEQNVRTKQGKILDAHMTIRLVNGVIEGFIEDITSRRQIEKAQKESEEKYRLLFENAPTGIILVDKNGKILEINPRMVEIIGSPSAEKTKEINVLTFQPLIDAGMSEYYRNCLTNGEKAVFEAPYITKWGKETYLRLVITPTFDDDNKITGCITVFEDIKHQKLAEAELNKSLSLLQSTLESTADGILVVNPSQEIVVYNERFRAMWGIPHDLLKKGDDKFALAFVLDQLVDPDEFLSKVNKLYSQPDIDSSDTLFLKDGRVFERYSQPQRLDNEIVGRVWSFRDVTAQKHAEETLLESEEKFSKTFLLSPAPIAITRFDDGVFVLVNEGLKRVFGYAEDEVIGKTALELNMWGDPKDRDRYIEKLKTEGRVDNFDLRFRTKKGDIRYGLMSAAVIDLKGVKHILSVTKDTTERKMAEQELKRTRDELELRVEERTNNLLRANENLEVEIAVRQRAERELQASHNRLELALSVASQLRVQAEAASAAKSEFLTNMSHELRTPLTAVIGFSDLLAEQLFGKLNEKQSGYVKEISAAGHHLLRLINDILDLAKVESGKMDVRLSPVDLNELLEHCLIMIRETARRRGLTVDLKVSEDLHDAMIQADDVRLKQIVMNLLSNAAKFTPSGGAIRLEAERRGDEILVSVSDTGIGLKPDDQKRIFEAFERLDSSLSRQEQGTGLGLALVGKLVELHKGHIWVESDGDGMGSTFRFTFPFIQAEKAEIQVAPESLSFPPPSLSDISRGDKNRPKVLVVEDNESNMKLVTNLLEAGGYDSLQAFSAEEATRIAEFEKPALIIMDISLPCMDGLTATKLLKNNPLTAHIPVVALTAHAMKHDEAKAKEAGCDSFILKPIDTMIFYNTLSGLIKSGGSGSQHS